MCGRVAERPEPVEASFAVLFPRGLGLRLACQVGTPAVELHARLGDAEQSCKEGRTRAHQFALFSSQLSHMAGFGRYACWRAAEVDAALGHPHHDEYLWRCGYG